MIISKFENIYAKVSQTTDTSVQSLADSSEQHSSEGNQPLGRRAMYVSQRSPALDIDIVFAGLLSDRRLMFVFD